MVSTFFGIFFSTLKQMFYDENLAPLARAAIRPALIQPIRTISITPRFLLESDAIFADMGGRINADAVKKVKG